jgi:7-cyano-7-deazaguanine synthase
VTQAKSKAYVLHSGGIDSTVCLYCAMRDFGHSNVVAVSVDYGQRHRKEIDYSKVLCNTLGIEHREIQLEGMPRSMLTDTKQKIPEVSYDELQGVSPTYVPFRNGQLLSKIAGIASADTSGAAIYFGAHAEDAKNWAYPDCTPEFIGAMANAIYIGTYHQVRLHTPIQWLTKKEIILLGESLWVDFEFTWSCYVGGVQHCGVCPTCRARKQGFIDSLVKDPTEYAA